MFVLYKYQVTAFTARICAVCASVIATEKSLHFSQGHAFVLSSFRKSINLAYASLICWTCSFPDGLNVSPTAFCQNVSSVIIYKKKLKQSGYISE